jgi:hypothetical protein
MEIWATIAGIAVAGAVAVYFHNTKPAGMGRALQLVVIAAAAALSAAVTGFGLKYVTTQDNASAVEDALQVVREAPLVGLVLKENPDVEARFRRAIEAEIRNPTRNGPQQTFVVGGEVRRDIIVPALRNADDASALDAIKAMQAFVKYLQGTDPALCKQFGLIGIQNPSRLSSDGGALFRRSLAAQEGAYLNGRARPAAPQKLTDQEVTGLLTEAGYTAADFEKVVGLAKLSDADGCAIIAKLYAAPALLPPPRAGMLARYLLTVS